MSRQQFKRDIRKILSDENFTSKLEILETFPEHIVVNLLFTSLCDPDAKVRANAVTAFGWLIPRIADRDMEAARIIMRRCLWSMNDEPERGF